MWHIHADTGKDTEILSTYIIPNIPKTTAIVMIVTEPCHGKGYTI